MDSGSEGNYYSDYTGTDPDGDCIDEDPSLISGGGGSVDNFLLMQTWAGDTPQKGDLNGDYQITPPQTPRSRSDSQPPAHKTPHPTSAAMSGSPPSMRS